MKLTVSYRFLFALFFAVLGFCLGARLWIRHSGLIALDTGFYSGAGELVFAFNAVLALGVVSFYLFYLLRRTERDYPVVCGSKPLGLLAIFAGISIALFQLEALRVPVLATANPGVRLDGIPLIFSATLGLFSAAAFIAVGCFGMFSRGGVRGGVLSLFSGVWLLLTLVFKFNDFTTLTSISDNLLTVLFMVFGALFLVGHARTLSGLSRKDGRNYTIPSGLATALFGFLLVIPNWSAAVMDGTNSLPAPLLGSFESLFVFVMSFYALLFVRRTCLNIQRV
ncbi:MAG: hypothetical protein FWE32_11860 [Oscillospiraceae bacterium]|nr:hypothetical protein [Oscillospiraceae bacterium]